MNNQYYLISTMGTKARQARTKNLLEVVDKNFQPDEYIFIHEDGKCIFHGLKKEFSIA